MNLLHSVVDAVQQGATTTQELAALFPGVAWTRIKHAAQNAAFVGYIRNTGTTRAAVWEFVRTPEPKGRPAKKPTVAPVSSVFEMGERIAHGQPCWVQRKPRQDFDNPSAG
jgi:hypothetical protein